ncbi:hypothetical protein U472_02670 [Orenia metallireducens]|uniref:Fe/B12 periplasmic-binding domain-containing protein n=1 Tax=Orenia metallireducens TaxID=1413210 RepID=A0A1C0ACM4_9FIRM|nr:cobalamin-binding protein [Orenia metallireducens]OCL28114.1 hypothetical protein U472_02670 [Orenia metallireducens]
MLKRMDRLLLTVFILVLLFSRYGEAEANSKVRLVDDLGKVIVIEKEPQRIISLAPSITEVLYELNLEERIVGVTDFCDYPTEAKSKTKVGANNLESIIALNPDLVIAGGIVPKDTIRRLEDLGITIVGFNPTNIEETITVIDKIAKLTGESSRGREVTERLRAELNYITKKVERVVSTEGSVKVFYEVWKNPLYTVGQTTFINDLIEKAGGYNIGTKADGAWPQYSMEQLLVENPDVYIATYDSWKERMTPAKIKARANYQHIKAIKDDRVYIFDADIINRPGPRIIKALRLFVQAIHPEIDLGN